MPLNKIVPDLTTAIAGIQDGMDLMIGGFGGSGAPIELIQALVDRYLLTKLPSR